MAWHVAAAVSRSRPPAPAGKVDVMLTWWVTDRRRRDPDGLYPALKACLDALVARGVLVDDDYTHVDIAATRIRRVELGPARMTLDIRYHEAPSTPANT